MEYFDLLAKGVVIKSFIKCLICKNSAIQTFNFKKIYLPLLEHD